MTLIPRYRKVLLGGTSIQTQRGESGITYAKTMEPLRDYPVRLTDRLIHWAQVSPERTFIAKRDGAGKWRRLYYATALDSTRHIGQALLDRGLSSERPVVILSENDLEHAILALACQYVGVPYAPVSPAYSFGSEDFDKLRHVMQTLTPGLVFAASGSRFGKAVRATLPSGCVSGHPLTAVKSPIRDRSTSALC